MSQVDTDNQDDSMMPVMHTSENSKCPASAGIIVIHSSTILEVSFF